MDKVVFSVVGEAVGPVCYGASWLGLVFFDNAEVKGSGVDGVHAVSQCLVV